MSEAMNNQGPAAESLLGRVAREYSQRVAAGEAPGVDEYAEQYEEIAPLIREVLPLLNLTNESATEAEFEAEVRRNVGDFRLIAEIGRGGMGIVYEAEQLSMGRKVALKMLPFAAVMDDNLLARFRNEVRVAATLDHPNIVPIYQVGEERGIHFYSMQLIKGHSLAEVVKQLREAEKQRTSPQELSAEAVSAEQSWLHRHGNDTTKFVKDLDAPSTYPTGIPIGDTTQTEFSSAKSHRSAAFARTVAKIGIQAADALQHAHEQGIVHRDIKPANLLVDQHGKIWVTDFGLARVATDHSMTLSGELVGTIRYLAPERTSGNRAISDERADIYALGVTLYELLALRCPFIDRDYHKLLKQITTDDAPPPRKWNNAIPIELETIILKAIAKEPMDRYGSAQEFADDLQRFLDHRPLLARRTSPLEHGKKWLRRHAPVVSITLTALILFSLTAAGLLWREQLRTEDARDLAESNLSLALEALDKIYLQIVGKEDEMRRFEVGTAFEQFSDEQLALFNESLHFYEEFAKQNRESRRGRIQVATAYFRIGVLHSKVRAFDASEEAIYKAIDLLLIGQEAYPDAAYYPTEIAKDYRFLGIMYQYTGRDPLAEKAFRKSLKYAHMAMDLAPDEPWAHGIAGRAHLEMRQLDKAEEHYRRQIALGGGEWEPNFYLGVICRLKRDYGSALKYLNRSIELDGEYLSAYSERGSVYLDQRRSKEAFDEFDRLIAIDPTRGKAYHGRASALWQQKKIDEALKDTELAIRWAPNLALAYRTRGILLTIKKRYDDALEMLEKATELSPNFGPAYAAKASALIGKGELEAAIQASDDAIKRGDRSPYPHRDKARALVLLGRLDEALEDFQWIQDRYRNYGPAYLGEAEIRERRGEFVEALGLLNQAFEIEKQNPVARYHLAILLACCPVDELRDPKRAMTLANEVSEKVPYWPHLQTVIGAAHLHADRLWESLSVLGKAAPKLDGRDLAINQFLRSIVYSKLEKDDEAQEAFRLGRKKYTEGKLEDKLAESLHDLAKEFLDDGE